MANKAGRPKKASRVCKVENLNQEKNIYTSMSVNTKEDNREYVVCLCLENKMVKTSFPTEAGALHEMRRYRSLYREIKPKVAPKKSSHY